MNFIQRLFNVHIQTEFHVRAEFFRKFAMFIEYLFIVYLFLHVLAVLMFFLAPIYMYIVIGEVTIIAPMYFPFFDETTTIGFIGTFLTLTVMFLLGLVGFLAFEFFISAVIICSLIFSKLIQLDMKQLDVELEEERIDDAKYRFVNIVLMHQEMNE